MDSNFRFFLSFFFLLPHTLLQMNKQVRSSDLNKTEVFFLFLALILIFTNVFEIAMCALQKYSEFQVKFVF